MATVRAAIYLRVSTTLQHSALQSDACIALAKQRGWKVVRTFADEGLSGTNDKRPALRELLAEAKRGAFDVVVSYKLDRVGRSTPHLLATLAELDACGVKYVSVTEPIDTSSALGTMITTVLSAIAQFERDMLIERTRDGLAATKRRGTRLGRPKRSIDMNVARDLRARGWSFERIAKKLGVGQGTLFRALKEARAN